MPEPETEIIDVPEDEVIIDESPGGEPGTTRTIRIYDRGRGDFTLEIPSECCITFGYFNPAAPKFAQSPDRYSQRPSDIAAATALRIYKGKDSKTPQLACFLDVQGFRDLSLKLTRLRQRVVIESNFEDDGDGNQNFMRNQKLALNPVAEDPDIPF